jgi:hypothetical protein
MTKDAVAKDRPAAASSTTAAESIDRACLSPALDPRSTLQSPAPIDPGGLALLHQSIGNQGVQRLIRSRSAVDQTPPVQRVVRVGNQTYTKEQEADFISLFGGALPEKRLQAVISQLRSTTTEYIYKDESSLKKGTALIKPLASNPSNAPSKPTSQPLPSSSGNVLSRPKHQPQPAPAPATTVTSERNDKPTSSTPVNPNKQEDDSFSAKPTILASKGSGGGANDIINQLLQGQLFLKNSSNISKHTNFLSLLSSNDVSILESGDPGAAVAVSQRHGLNYDKIKCDTHEAGRQTVLWYQALKTAAENLSLIIKAPVSLIKKDDRVVNSLFSMLGKPVTCNMRSVGLASQAVYFSTILLEMAQGKSAPIESIDDADEEESKPVKIDPEQEAKQQTIRKIILSGVTTSFTEAQSIERIMTSERLDMEKAVEKYRRSTAQSSSKLTRDSDSESDDDSKGKLDDDLDLLIYADYLSDLDQDLINNCLIHAIAESVKAPLDDDLIRDIREALQQQANQVPGKFIEANSTTIKIIVSFLLGTKGAVQIYTGSAEAPTETIGEGSVVAKIYFNTDHFKKL